MARTSSTSIGPPTKGRDQLERLAQDATARVVDLKIVWTRALTGERLFEAGGRWDRVDGVFLDEPPRRCKVFAVNEAQVDSARALGAALRARLAGDVSRPVEIILEGGRGSGKSVEGVLAVFTFAIALPDSRCFLVSTANTRKDELQRIVSDHIPPKWRAWSERDVTYTLPNGSTIQYLGSDDEDALRKGGYEIALANEMQLFTWSAYSTLVAGVRNVSQRPRGLFVGAMNPATKIRGEWTDDLLDKIDGGQLNSLHFKLDPQLNQFLEAGVVDEVDAHIRAVNPAQADADAKGIRKRLSERAAPAFRPWLNTVLGKKDDGEPDYGHVGRPPDLAPPDKRWTNVTEEITEQKIGRRYRIIVGVDFQKRPGCVGVVFELWRRPDGRIVYRALRYLGGEETDNEDELARRIDAYAASRDIEARDVLVIADSSGRWQEAAHRHGAKPSIAILEEWFFRVVPVVQPRGDARNTSGAGRNPDVPDNLAQLYDVCVANRFLVEPSEEWIVECLRRCKTKKRGGSLRLDDSRPGYSHVVDCIRYVIHWFEPKRGVAKPAPSLSGLHVGRRI